MIRGGAVFDGIALGEGSFSFLAPTIHLEAKAAFVNSQTGSTHGWTTCKLWSPETIAKLSELKALMEQDLGRVHLQDGGELTVPTATSKEALGGGLGEHLKEPPQI